MRSPLVLRDLLAHPGLRLRYGGQDPDAALDRPVRWVYTTDLIDPGRYLGGGELVISGLVWRHDPADSERFVAAVAGAGAVALAAGAAVFHGIPDDVVAACRRHDLPLLEVPEEVSFATVTDRVVGALTAARGDRLAGMLGRQRRLLSAVAEGIGIAELAAEIGATTGTVIRVFTATGNAVVEGPEPLPPTDVDAAVQAFLTAERLPVVIAGGRSVLPVGSAIERRLTSWFVTVDGELGGDEQAESVGELVAIVALDRGRRAEGLQVTGHIAQDAIARVVAGSGDHPETAVRLRQAGLDPGGPLVVAVAGFAGTAGNPETARLLLADATAHVGPSAVGEHDGLAVALLSPGSADAACAEVLAAALRRIAPGLAIGERFLLGTSRPARTAALSGALQEARYARELAASRPGPVQAATAAELTSHVALLAAVPDELRRAFANRLLEPVRAFDARTGAGLMETLTAFLDHSGSWSRTAGLLHIHVNTVRYRIGQIEKLTGRDLSHFPDRVDIYLALRSLPLGG